MDDFLKWVRSRFTMIDLMRLDDDEDETLKLLMFENGPSRDEFIKLLVYKLLLDNFSDTKVHDLEKVFVTFGLLDKETAHNFLKGCMSTKLHINTWKKILEALIPTTTISTQWPSYDEFIVNIYEKSNYFQSVIKKNYLPPELLPKLKSETRLKTNSEYTEEKLDKLIEIIENQIKPDENCEKQSTNCADSEFMDLASIEREIEEYIKVANDNMVVSLINEQSIKMSPQEFIEFTKTRNLTHTNLELKVEEIYKLLKVEQDLQILANALADQLKSDTVDDEDVLTNTSG